jgi:hypothetical protein
MTEINMETAERIAYADTKHLGRPRWSELSVHYLKEPADGGKRWLALSVGMSEKPGERPITDKLLTFSLERALDLFDDSPIGKQVKAQARDWAEEREAGDEVAGHPIAQPAAGEAFTGSTDEEALAWLFGPEHKGREAARVLGVGESTMRAALKNGTGIKVPLVHVLPFLDRARFLAEVTDG